MRPKVRCPCHLQKGIDACLGARLRKKPEPWWSECGKVSGWPPHCSFSLLPLIKGRRVPRNCFQACSCVTVLSCDLNCPSLFLHLSLSLIPRAHLIEVRKKESKEIWGLPNLLWHKEMFSSVKGGGGKPGAWLTFQQRACGDCPFKAPHWVFPGSQRALIYLTLRGARGATVPPAWCRTPC